MNTKIKNEYIWGNMRIFISLMTEKMKRNLNILISILSIICVVVLSACGKDNTYKVDGEEEAIRIYSCPVDNMFGLEKVVVFEDRVIAVFDKEISDDSEYGKIAYNERKGYLPAGARLSNLSTYKGGESTLEEKDGKYIVTVGFEYDEANKIDSNKEIEITGFAVCGRNIYFNDGDLQLLYTFEGGDCFEDFCQDYSGDEGEWGEIQYKCIDSPMLEVE